MRKLLSLVLIAGMSIVLVGCGSKEEDTNIVVDENKPSKFNMSTSKGGASGSGGAATEKSTAATSKE